jgi:hypothetical protein
MTDSPDIFAAIDAAVGCQQCTGPLGDSPSGDFCSDDCQTAWHTERADQLTGYREPYEHPDGLPGIGSTFYSTTADRDPRPVPDIWLTVIPGVGVFFAVGQRPEFRLPPETADLAADWRAVRTAAVAADTDTQRAAVVLRAASLRTRSNAVITDALRHITDGIGSALAQFAEAIGPVLASFHDGLQRAFGATPGGVAHRHPHSRAECTTAADQRPAWPGQGWPSPRHHDVRPSTAPATTARPRTPRSGHR